MLGGSYGWRCRETPRLGYWPGPSPENMRGATTVYIQFVCFAQSAHGIEKGATGLPCFDAKMLADIIHDSRPILPLKVIKGGQNPVSKCTRPYGWRKRRRRS